MSKPGKQTKAQAQRSKRIVMNKNAARLLPGRMSETLCEAAKIAGATAGTVTLASTLSATPAHALPQNGTVVGGSASISQTGASTLNINQTTNSAIINWKGYNIGASELVQYNQPGSSSIILNRVTGGDPSVILGSLSANGQVWVINPNGLLVGPGAKVHTGSFLGSTLGISNEDFSAGNYRLTGAPSSLASIINHGNIQSADGGYVVLAAPSVTNTGTIAAHLGKVALASGDQLTLGFQGNDLIDIVISEEAASGALGVKNTGSITADGGSVILSAKVAGDLLKEVVNNEGIIQATSIVEKDGVIILDGGDNGIVTNSGTLDASGMDAGESGGTVKVLGNQVEIASGATIDASGDAGGGTVLIGGNFKGAGSEGNSSTTTIAQGAVIKADAVTDGDGGNVAVWSDGTTEFHGKISAKGGAAGGDGGHAEVSGKEHLAISGFADLVAPKGKAGVLEVDPGSVLITHGAPAASAGMDTITDGWINTQMGGGDLTISTTDSTNGLDQNISLNSDVGIAWNSTNTLTFSAGSEIYLYGSITAPNGFLRVNFDQSGAGAHLRFRAAVNVPNVLISGYGSNSRIIGPADDDTSFRVTGENSGRIDGKYDFIKVGHIGGGWGADTFIIEKTGSLTGGVYGGGGKNKLDLSAKDNVTFNQELRSATDVAYVDVQEVVGNGVNSTLIGRNADRTYNISGAGSGNVVQDQQVILEFSGFGNLAGGTWNDTFNFQDGGSLSGTLNGGGDLGNDILNYAARTGAVAINQQTGTATGIGTTFSGIEAVVGNGVNSTLIGVDAGETFTVTGADAGTAGALGFTGVGNLTGGSGSDTFVLQDAGSLSGNVVGGDAADSLDLSGKTGAVTFDKQNGTATGIGGTFSGIETVVGNGTGSTIIGADVGETFTVTGADAGTAGALAFTGVGNLTGGSGNDSIVLQAGGNLSGNVAGGDGTDLLDLSAKVGAVTFDQQNSTATGIGGTYSGIETVAGNGTGSTIIGADAGETFTVSGADAGTAGALGFTGVGDLTGGSGSDTFVLQDAGSLSGNVVGGDGADSLDLSAKVGDVVFDTRNNTATDIGGSFSGTESVAGNGAKSTIIGTDAGETFTVTGADAGTVGALGFTGVGNLTSGSGNDTFVLQDAGTLSGNVVGGGGANSLDLSAKVGNVIFDKRNSTATDIAGTFSGIETLLGNGVMSTIIGTDAGETFTVTGADAGTAGAVAFTGVGNLTGGSGNDSIVLQDGGNLSGNAVGGSGTDSLDLSGKVGAVTFDMQNSTATGIGGTFSGIETVTGNGTGSTIVGTDAGETFTVTGADAGIAGAVAFTGVGNLTGGTGNDTFVLQDAGRLSGNLYGNGGADLLDMSAKTGAVILDRHNNTATDIAGTLFGIESVTGNGAKSTIIAADAGEAFTVSGVDTGTVGDLAFSGVGNLTGGAGDDGIILEESGRLTGSVAGGAGTDVLALNPKTGDVVFDLQQNTATDIAGTFSDIETLSGNGTRSTITGADAGEAFTVTAGDTGTAGTLVFVGVGNLTGGSGNDTFVLQDAGSLSGNVVGGGGADALDLSAKLGNVIFDKQNSTATDIGGTFSDIESIAGNGAKSTIFGADAGEIFTVNGADIGTVGALSFTGVGNLTGGTGNDSFALQDAGTLSGNLADFDGADSLDLSAKTGDVVFDRENSTVTGVVGIYSGMESVVGNGAKSTIVANALGEAFTVTGADAGTVGELAFSGVGNLTGGDGDDSFILQQGGVLSGSVAGGAGADALNLNAKVGEVIFNKENSTATDIAGTFSDMETVAGNGLNSKIVGANAGEIFTVTAGDTGTVGTLGFVSVGNLTGGSGNDTLVLQDGGSLSGSVVGGGGADSLDLSAKVGNVIFNKQNRTATDIGGTFTDIEAVAGNGINSTIIGADSGETFTVTNADTGTVGALGFTGVGNLIGGTGNDSFFFEDVGSLSGNLADLDGADSLDLSAKMGNVVFDREHSTVTGVAGIFSGIESVAGNGANSTIKAREAGEAFTVTGADAGTVDELAFSGVGNLAGGAGDDSFILENLGSLSGSVSGGGGTDVLNLNGKLGAVVFDKQNSTATDIAGKFSDIETVAGNGLNSRLVGLDAGETFTVTAGDTGTVGTLQFVSVGNLTGGSGNDTFVLQDGGSLSGSADGGGGADSLDLSAKVGNVIFNKQNRTATDIGGTFTDIEAVAGNGINSTIIGADSEETFTVTNADTGTVGALGFTDVGNLIGGTGNDSFFFEDAGSLSGNLADLAGADSLDQSAKMGNVVFDREHSTVTGVAGIFSGIESVAGNGANSTIKARDAGEAFTVTGADAGTVEELAFSGVGNLTGGDGDDSFILQNQGTLSGSVAGGGGANALNLNAKVGEVIFNKESRTATGIAGKFSEIGTVAGNGANSTIVGLNAGETFTVTAGDAGTVGELKFASIGSLTGGSGNDSFILQNAGSLSGNVVGGGGFDTLDMSAKVGEVTFNRQNSTATGIAKKYTGIESVVGNGANSTIIAIDAGETFTVTGADAGTVGTLGFTGVGSLAGGLGDDSIVLHAGGTLSGKVVGGGGYDSLNLAAKPVVTFNLETRKATDIGGSFDVEKIAGNGANSTIFGRDISQTYKITERDSGTVGVGEDVDLAFTGVGNLTGGSRDDYFLIKPDGSVSGNLEGGGDSDHLFVSSKPTEVTFNLEDSKVSYVDGKFTGFEHIAGNGANSTIIGRNISQTYKITGRDSGTVGVGEDVDLAFSAIGNLTGGSRDDYFLIKPDGSVSGSLKGGGDSDHLFVSSKPGAVVFDLEHNTVSYVDGTFTEFENIAGNGTSSTIVGSNAGQTFTITGNDAGTVDGLNFIAVGHLAAGTGNDTFIGMEGSKLSGTLGDFGGSVTLAGALTAEMSQSYFGEATLASNTNLKAPTVFLGGVAGNGNDLTIDGNAELHTADITGVRNFHVTGTTMSTVANISSSGTQLYDQKVTLGQDAHMSGSAITVNAVDGANHDLTMTSSGSGGITIKDAVTTSGDVTLEAAAGSITETGSGRISAASLTTASAGGQALGGANTVQSFSGANSGAGSIEFKNSSETLTIAGIENGGNIEVTNHGRIAVTGVINTPGNVSLTANGGTITESGAGAVTNAAQLTTNSTGGQTLGGPNSVRSFSATNTGGDVILRNSAPNLTLAGISQTAGGKIEVTNTGEITIGGAGKVETTGNVVLDAGGSITEGDGAVIKAATLTTKSRGGQSLLGANSVDSFTADNAGGGTVAFKNDSSSVLHLGQVVQTGGGDIRITNRGDVNITGLASTSDSDTLALTSENGRITTGGDGSLQAGALELTAETIGAGDSHRIKIDARSVTTNTTGEVAGVSGDFVGSAREFTANDAVPSVVLLNGTVVAGKLGSGFREAVQLGGSNAAMAVNAQEMQKMLMLANFQEFFSQAPNSYFVDADDPAFAPVQEVIPGFLSDGRPCQLIDSKIK